METRHKSNSGGKLIWLYKPLWKISSGDYVVILNVETKIQGIFALIGAIVFANSTLTIISLSYCLKNVFSNSIAVIPLSLFLGFLMSSIYLLLLITLDKNQLPVKKEKRLLNALKISMVIRLASILFFSFILSKSLEVYLFRDALKNDIRVFKETEIDKNTFEITSIYNQKIEIEKEKIYDLTRTQTIFNQDKSEEIKEILKRIDDHKASLANDITKMKMLINKSNHFFRQICFLVQNHPLSWLVTLSLCFFFLLPAMLKYGIAMNSSYYQRKASIEKGMIEDEYKSFKNIHQYIIAYRYNILVDIYEPYSDPPFNTIKKTDSRNFDSQSELIKNIYSE